MKFEISHIEKNNTEFKDRELKIFRKVLMEHSFNKDGYEYHFLSIEPDEKGWSYDIIINVVLPEKGQSYATPVFSGHIHDILSNIWKYVGSSFSYSEKILVDGKEPIKGGVFISSEKQREVLFAMRREVKEVTLKTAIGPLTFDVYWRPMEKFYGTKYVAMLGFLGPLFFILVGIMYLVRRIQGKKVWNGIPAKT